MLMMNKLTKTMYMHIAGAIIPSSSSSGGNGFMKRTGGGPPFATPDGSGCTVPPWRTTGCTNSREREEGPARPFPIPSLPLGGTATQSTKTQWKVPRVSTASVIRAAWMNVSPRPRLLTDQYIDPQNRPCDARSIRAPPRRPLRGSCSSAHTRSRYLHIYIYMWV